MREIVLGSFILVLCISLGLRWLNLRHLREHGKSVPRELEGNIDEKTLQKITSYTEERSRLGFVTSTFMNGLMVLFLFGGGIDLYDRFVSQTSESWFVSGLVFFFGLFLAEMLIGIPFSLYANFKIEAKYGFNRMSLGLWLSDLLKNLLLSTILGALVVLGSLWLVQAAPTTWWLWVWAFFAFVSLLLMYIAPYVIEPLFFKIEPLQVPGLEAEVRALSERCGVQIKHVLQMDASRRSGHSNAYFTGIGRVKRVVLFDTLLTQMTHAEILGVLAHELGHWKKGHIIKTLILSQCLALFACFGAYQLVNWDGLPTLFASSAGSFPARVVFVLFLGSVLLFPVTPFFSYWSRRHEWEADQFACSLTDDPESLASALAKLARDNLANLHPHPLYAAFYYTHPPMAERIRKLLAAKQPVTFQLGPPDSGARGHDGSALKSGI